jgi:hypothetical protein
MANSFQIGSAHPYPWPKTIGFHTLNTTDDIIQHLKNNKIWTVSEKLDGCNLCLSTQGWIASRNIIVSNRESPKLVYQGVQLNKVHEIFLKMDKLKILLQKHLISNVNFDVMVYGELILQGTATTKHDIFNYKESFFTIKIFLLYHSVFFLKKYLINVTLTAHPFWQLEISMKLLKMTFLKTK